MKVNDGWGNKRNLEQSATIEAYKKDDSLREKKK
jgi:hypothetical protein